MWIAIIVVLLLFVALSFSRFEIKSEIEINATASEVWKAIIDFDNYSKWNTQLMYLGGEVKPKGQLHLKLAVDGTAPYEFKPDISYWEENKRFAWIARTGGMPRLFDGEHFFEIIPLDDTCVKVINREEYRGLLSQIMKTLPMMKEAPAGFDKMNQELKAYVEMGRTIDPMA